MNTINDTGLVRLIEDTAANKIVADRSQWVARGDGVKPDGSDNAQVTSEASNIYLPIDGLRTDIKEFYDPYEIDDGDFIFAPYSSGTSCELRISNVKWSKDGVELYKVCGGELSDYGKSEDGLPWYKVEGYEECSTTQNIMAYLLEDDTVKITTGSESNYKDKVLIATVKDGVINRIVKSVIMKSASVEQIEIVRDWTVRYNGVRWEIFNPVWNLGDKQAVYPQSMDALCWNAVTDTSGKLYANLVSENKIADDGTVTTDRSVILSSTENDIGQACVSLTSVSSVLIGEFKKDCDGNITGFCQYSDGAIAQAGPKVSTINVFTSFKTATVETTGSPSSSSSTETHLQGFTTPIQVVAGKECTEPPALDIKLSDITGGSSDSWVPSVYISDIVDTSSSSSGTITGQKIAISFTCNTTGEVISDEGSVYNGINGGTYTPAISSTKIGCDTNVTISFSKEGEQDITHTFTVKDGSNGENGADGEDGKFFTPSVSETTSTGPYEETVHNVTISFTDSKTNAVTSHTIDIKDGAKGDKGDTGDQGPEGPYFIPDLTVEEVLESSVVVANKLTFNFTKSDDSTVKKSFGPIEVKNGVGGGNATSYGYGPISIITKNGKFVMRQEKGTFDKDGNFTGSGKYVDTEMNSLSVFTAMNYCFNTGSYQATTTPIPVFGSGVTGTSEVTAQPALVNLSLDSNALTATFGNFSSASGSLDTGSYSTIKTASVANVASLQPVGCDSDGLSVMMCAVTLLPTGETNSGVSSVIRKIDGNVVTGGKYTPPSSDGSLGKVSLCYKKDASFAAFVDGIPTDAEQVLIYTAVSTAQEADTYQNA